MFMIGDIPRYAERADDLFVFIEQRHLGSMIPVPALVIPDGQFFFV